MMKVKETMESTCKFCSLICQHLSEAISLNVLTFSLIVAATEKGKQAAQ